MDEPIRFWDYSYANLDEARAKLEAATAALAETVQRIEYLRGVAARPLFSNNPNVQRQIAELAELAINRHTHVAHWQGIVG